MANTSAKKKVKKREKVDSVGCAYVSATFNNTVISLTDNYGNVISWSSVLIGFIRFCKGVKNNVWQPTQR